MELMSRGLQRTLLAVCLGAGLVLLGGCKSGSEGMPRSTGLRLEDANPQTARRVFSFTPRTERVALKKRRSPSIPETAIYHTPAACSDERHEDDATHVTERGRGRVLAGRVPPGARSRRERPCDFSSCVFARAAPAIDIAKSGSMKKNLGRGIERGRAERSFGP